MDDRCRTAGDGLGPRVDFVINECRWATRIQDASISGICAWVHWENGFVRVDVKRAGECVDGSGKKTVIRTPGKKTRGGRYQTRKKVDGARDAIKMSKCGALASVLPFFRYLSPLYSPIFLHPVSVLCFLPVLLHVFLLPIFLLNLSSSFAFGIFAFSIRRCRQAEIRPPDLIDVENKRQTNTSWLYSAW